MALLVASSKIRIPVLPIIISNGIEKLAISTFKRTPPLAINWS